MPIVVDKRLRNFSWVSSDVQRHPNFATVIRRGFRASRRDADLSAGVLARPGIYVVRHYDPIHALPHEILISTATILPECNACRGVRFS
jgi:hypothetical protein